MNTSIYKEKRGEELEIIIEYIFDFYLSHQGHFNSLKELEIRLTEHLSEMGYYNHFGEKYSVGTVHLYLRIARVNNGEATGQLKEEKDRMFELLTFLLLPYNRKAGYTEKVDVEKIQNTLEKNGFEMSWVKVYQLIQNQVTRLKKEGVLISVYYRKGTLDRFKLEKKVEQQWKRMGPRTVPGVKLDLNYLINTPQELWTEEEKESFQKHWEETRRSFIPN